MSTQQSKQVGEKRNALEGTSTPPTKLPKVAEVSKPETISEHSGPADVIAYFQWWSTKDRPLSQKEQNLWNNAFQIIDDQGISGSILFGQSVDLLNMLTGDPPQNYGIPTTPARAIATHIHELKELNEYPDKWGVTSIQDFTKCLPKDFIHSADMFTGEYSCQENYLADTVQEIESLDTSRSEAYRLVLLAAGSGCGKTRLVFELWKEYSSKGHVCLPLTFNCDGLNPSDYLEDYEKNWSTESRLAERLFFCFLRYLGYNIDWKSYVKNKKFSFEEISTVTDIIFEYIDTEKKLIVLVDEFLKLSCTQKQRVLTLKALCKLRDGTYPHSKRFYFMVTSLTTLSWVTNELSKSSDITASNRDIYWLHLPKFNGQDIFESSVETIIQDKERESLKELRKKPEIYVPLTGNVLNFCGSHVRSIIYSSKSFVNLLRTHTGNIDLEEWVKRIAEDTINCLCGQYHWHALPLPRGSPKDALRLLSLCLLGCRIWNLPIKVNGGLLLSPETVPLFGWELLSQQGFLSADMANRNLEAHNAISIIVVLSIIYSDLGPACMDFLTLFTRQAADNTGNSMEQLVESWEVCTRILYSHGITRDNIFTPNVGEQVQVSLVDHYELECYHYAAYEHNFNTENFDTYMVWHGFLKHGFDLQNQDKRLIQSLNKKEGNEEGRDFQCTLFDTKTNNTIKIPIEVKYSGQSTKNSLLASHIMGKITLCDPNTLLLVIVSLRTVTKSPAAKMWDSVPVLILDKEWIVSIFGHISPLLTNT